MELLLQASRTKTMRAGWTDFAARAAGFALATTKANA
jgi:hypothetical protein